jgi:hypothetical protein
MPYRFTKADITPNTIVQSRELDNAVGTFADVINGGMDRDNIPVNAIGQLSCSDNFHHRIKIYSNINAPDSDLQPDANYVEPTPNRLGRLMYGYRYADDPTNSGGGYAVATTQALDVEEGMMEISWHCSEAKTQYWSYWKDHSSDKVALKSMQWQIRVDGNVVYTGPAQFEIMNTSVHRCTIPISKGTHTVSVHWRVPLQRDDDDQDQVVAVWWGAQLVIKNKYR